METFKTATLAGGCFWCTEAIFKRLKGVNSVTPGYSGGSKENHTYDEVSLGNTGHAESIQVKFDPRLLPYKKLLEVFFYTHDPTTPNQQGNDFGPQYRSVIFFHDDIQKNAAEEAISNLKESKKYSKPIVTQIEQFRKFYPAEDYHKNYYERHKDAPYCTFIITPKLRKLLDKYSNYLKEEYKTS